MPPDLLAKIHADVAKALDHPETTKFFSNNSFERVDLSPQDFGKLIQSDLEQWSALIKAAGAKVEGGRANAHAPADDRPGNAYRAWPARPRAGMAGAAAQARR